MIDQELLICFLDEALDSLSQWERACLDLETLPAPEVYQTLFRAAHNLKGASRTVGLEQFGAFVHCVEDLIKLLDGVGGQLRAGHYPDDAKAAKTARLLRAVADQLDV